MTDEIKNIIEFGGRDYFLEINNSVGQRWYFPYKHTRRFLSLYRPSSLKGKIVRLILPVVKYFPFALAFLHMRRVRISLNEQTAKLINNTLKSKDIEFALFCGSPGKHKKTTIMLREGKNILGYCKISDKQPVIDLFRREKATLDFLQEKNIDSVPQILFCNSISIDSETWLHLQTTKQKDNAITPTMYNKEVIDFIIDIKEKSSVELNYKDSEFYNAMRRLERIYPQFIDKDSHIAVSQCIRQIDEFYNSNKRCYTLAHGDFTPWNSIISNNKLFAFDFEYSHKSYPPFYDFFHFFTQSCIYDKNWDEDKIVKEYKKIKETILHKYITEDLCNIYYKCYLAGITEFYLTRDNGFLNSKIKECVTLWTNIIKRLNNE